MNRPSPGLAALDHPLPHAGEGPKENNGAFLPPPPVAKALTPQEDAERRADCSCPRGGGWRPGARWAEKERTARRSIEEQIAQLPPHQRPQMRELGRRTEPAPVAFKSSPERGGGPSA